ncbi:hypothetical protein IKQ_06179 [Bacillus cereus VDM053]|nr:hypothetical protein IKQ_06179 [Bacillus cereus VDM053]
MIKTKWIKILKFLALRPSQLITKKEICYLLLHDPHASNLVNEIQLVRQARKLVITRVVLEQWKKLYLINLRRLRTEMTPWEFVLLTTLVWLHPDLQLPVFP